MSVTIRKNATRRIHDLHVVAVSITGTTRQPIENLDRDLAAAVADGGSAEIAAAWAAHPGLEALVDALRAYPAS